jgi:hypothetical protein
MKTRIKILDDIDHKLYVQRWEANNKNFIEVRLNPEEGEILLSAIMSAIGWETRIQSFVDGIPAKETPEDSRVKKLKKIERKLSRHHWEDKDFITVSFNAEEWEFVYTAIHSVSVWEVRIDTFVDKKKDEA